MKEKLRKEYDKLNPVRPIREIVSLQNKLYKLAIGKMEAEEREFHVESKVMQ